MDNMATTQGAIMSGWQQTPAKRKKKNEERDNNSRSWHQASERSVKIRCVSVSGSQAGWAYSRTKEFKISSHFLKSIHLNSAVILHDKLELDHRSADAIWFSGENFGYFIKGRDTTITTISPKSIAEWLLCVSVSVHSGQQGWSLAAERTKTAFAFFMCVAFNIRISNESPCPNQAIFNARITKHACRLNHYKNSFIPLSTTATSSNKQQIVILSSIYKS